MKKKLPQIRKDLKNFILDEDAKVINKSATKIAITVTAFALSFSIGLKNVMAGGHTDHINKVLTSEDGLINFGENEIKRDINVYKYNGERTFNDAATIPPKSAKVVHANHYNHTGGGGGK